jgi:peptidoglycan/xylan/chitin deacetylase (PgdA/CDA1 family)
MNSPGIVLSFDDYSETWVRELPLLERLGIKATFFVTGDFVRDEPLAKNRLAPLVQAGHSLGVHTFTHRRATEMWKKEGAAWLTSDVLDQASLLSAIEGRPTQSFAYPYGDHDKATDRTLVKHFRFVRTFGKKPMFTTENDLRKGGITYATSIDNVQKRDNAWYEEQLTRLVRQSKIWVVASHHFNETDWGITPARLTYFAETAHRLGIRLLRFEDFI